MLTIGSLKLVVKTSAFMAAGVYFEKLAEIVLS